MKRNRYIVTPGRVHIAVDDPGRSDLSLETVCGRSLVDGLTVNSRWERLQDLTEFPYHYRCRVCFTSTGEDPAPGKLAPRSRWAKPVKR